MMKPRIRQILPVLLAALTLTPAPSKAGFGLFATVLGGEGQGSVVSFDTSGNATTFISGLNAPTGLAFDQSGNVYVAETNPNTDQGFVEKFSSSGHDLGTIATGLGNNAFNALAVNSSGDIYVGDEGNNLVREFSPTGQLLLTIGPVSPNGGPVNLALDAHGNLYVAAGFGIFEFSPSGQALGTFGTASLGFLAEPTGMAFDKSGNLFFESNNSGAPIVELSPTGQLVQTFTFGSGSLTFAIDGSGSFYQGRGEGADSSSSIETFSSSGQDLGVFATLDGIERLAFAPQPMATVPEPASLVMMGLGLAAVAGYVRIRQVREPFGA
jgi:PEP-CTERM motif